MKKYLKTLFLISLCCVTLTGCNRSENDTKQTSGKFDGDVTYMWDDVKDDFDKIDDDVENNTDYLNSLTKDDIANLTTTIREGYEKIKNGVTEDNQEEAKKVYEAAAKLEYLEKRGDEKLTDEEEEVLELGEKTKALMMHYYGKGEGNYNDAVDDIEEAFDRVKNFTDEQWDKLESKFE